MANNEALFSAFLSSGYRLPISIPAIQAACAPDGHAELGAISHLPADAELTFCGGGFNENTVKVRFGEQFYFIFLEDITAAKAITPAQAPDQVIDNAHRKPSQRQPTKHFAASHVA